MTGVRARNECALTKFSTCYAHVIIGTLLLPLLTGYWYVDVLDDSSLATTMAFTSDARVAFTFGLPLPPDDKVH